jgi:DNA repair protein RadD
MLALRQYQRAAVDAIPAYFERHKGHPLVIVPTAGGKSLIAAAFIQDVLRQWPDTRILIVTHVRELIRQNYDELLRLWPAAPAGIYSAGLNRRDTQAQILLCGIQSVHRRAYDIQRCDLLLIDEAHLVPRSGTTMYRKFIDDLATINSWLKIVGLTATPYRLDSGLLHEGDDALFTHVAYEISVATLIKEGWLSPLIGKRTATQLDVSGVGTRGGEFIAGELERAVDHDPITRAAIDEIVKYGADRHAWLLFCAGVDHARHVRDEVRTRGFSCESIDHKTAKDERDHIIAAFKRGEIRALASMNVLTTGFNATAVDLIAMLRPTKSAGLYVQMAGRGTRLASGKTDCLVLDFAGNIMRHGPIDCVQPHRPGNGNGGEAPAKVCPECDSIIAAAALECPDCGYVFPPREIKIVAQASELEIISNRIPEQWLDVSNVAYQRHEKPGKPPSLRVDYYCGLNRHSEWVCLQHEGYPRQKAVEWWRSRTGGPVVPGTVAEALQRMHELRPPKAIRVRPVGHYTQVIGARFS